MDSANDPKHPIIGVFVPDPGKKLRHEIGKALAEKRPVYLISKPKNKVTYAR